jgi:hypothetical protein
VSLLLVDDAFLVVALVFLGVVVVKASASVDATFVGVGLLLLLLTVLLTELLTVVSGLTRAFRCRRPTIVESGVTGTGSGPMVGIPEEVGTLSLWMEVVLRDFLVRGGREDREGIVNKGVVAMGFAVVAVAAVWLVDRRPRFLGVVCIGTSRLLGVGVGWTPCGSLRSESGISFLPLTWRNNDEDEYDLRRVLMGIVAPR